MLGDLHAKQTIIFLCSMFVGSSIAGWAMLLWEDKPINTKQKIGGVLLSGFTGVIVSLLLYERLRDAPTLLAGVSLLAGVGGASTIEFLAVIIKKRVTSRFEK